RSERPMKAKFSGSAASCAPRPAASSRRARASSRLAETSGPDVICIAAIRGMLDYYGGAGKRPQWGSAAAFVEDTQRVLDPRERPRAEARAGCSAAMDGQWHGL